jgi:hypothetical protein
MDMSHRPIPEPEFLRLSGTMNKVSLKHMEQKPRTRMLWTMPSLKAGTRPNGMSFSFFAVHDAYLVRRWKLRLRPKHLNLIQDLFLPKLPPSVTVDKIFEHHLVYIKEQLEAYISAQYGDGADIWKKLYPSMEVVLTTPNGWELAQQQRMRAAAQKAALVQGPDSAARVRFVSEAEVSFRLLDLCM